MRFIVIGIDDNHGRKFDEELLEIIGRGHNFSGGKRHRDIVEHLLPENAVWVDIVAPMSSVFKAYEAASEWVVFASGDPLFYGFANTIRRELPNAEIKLYPMFNSLQMLAHRLVLPYQDMKMVSLTGRDWQKFDEAVIEGCEKIGALTDGKRGPKEIASRLLAYGYNNYTICVGELLGNEGERVQEFELSEVSEYTFASPNCVILKRFRERPRPLGINESKFFLLNGREKMITKMPIRLISLSSLDLRGRECLWDIGFCTGSVSIEAKLQFPHLKIVAFEVREECRDIINKNSCKFGTPGIEVRIGNFLDTDVSAESRPNAVFIGGHGGHLSEIMYKVKEYILPGGVVVMNSVSEESGTEFERVATELGWHLSEPLRVALNDFNPIRIFRAEV